jgi:hypothetical protein
MVERRPAMTHVVERHVAETRVVGRHRPPSRPWLSVVPL